MKIYGCYALGRKTDLIISNLCNGVRMLDERMSVASGVVLEGRSGYAVCRADELESVLVISWI